MLTRKVPIAKDGVVKKDFNRVANLMTRIVAGRRMRCRFIFTKNATQGELLLSEVNGI